MTPIRHLVVLLGVLMVLCPIAAGVGPGDSGPPEDRGPEPGSDRDHDATTHHHFHDIDHWVEVFEDPGRDDWQQPERVVAALGLGDGDVIADLGAGTGYFTLHLARAVAPGGAVFAVDIEPGMVGYIGERSRRESVRNVTPVLALADDPMLPPAGVDLVFLCDTFHHIDDRVAYLHRLRENLKPEGRIAVIDFRKRELPVGPPPEHKLSREQVAEEFLEAGYVLAEEKDFLPYQFFLIFRPAAAGSSSGVRDRTDP